MAHYPDQEPLADSFANSVIGERGVITLHGAGNPHFELFKEGDASRLADVSVQCQSPGERQETQSDL